MDKARQSIESLMEIAPKEALVRRENKEILIPVEDIQIDDVMVVKPGQKLAMDGIVMKGTSTINRGCFTFLAFSSLILIFSKAPAFSISSIVASPSTVILAAPKFTLQSTTPSIAFTLYSKGYLNEVIVCKFPTIGTKIVWGIMDCMMGDVISKIICSSFFTFSCSSFN